MADDPATLTSTIPVIDFADFPTGPAALSASGQDHRALARSIRSACREHGFFYVVGHGIERALTDRLERLSRTFFARPEADKLAISMDRGGRAWRGYFPVGHELTSARPDRKEGLYLGAELPVDDPRVVAGLPLHGSNLFPANLPGFRDTALATMDALTALGHRIMAALALSLGLSPSYFHERYTADPLILFRIFHYPPNIDDQPAQSPAPPWGVGEHTDYGLLTILYQDAVGGLQVKTPGAWIDAPPVPGSFVCNLGDMLDRMTGGLYRSTPHRVRNASSQGRLSFPFFFDPGFDARVRSIDPGAEVIDDAGERWDRRSVHTFEGTYGEYLLAKVAQVFPQLGATHL